MGGWELMFEGGEPGGEFGDLPLQPILPGHEVGRALRQAGVRRHGTYSNASSCRPHVKLARCSLPGVSERAERRVLVIDDDELSLEVLSLLLREEGYAVDAAGSGEEALLALGRPGARPDVILMDMQMPGLSGNELARRLREACDGSTPLIAMSGSRRPEAEWESCDAFLLKPFSMAELTGILGEQQQGFPGSAGGVVPGLAAAGEKVLDRAIFDGFKAMVGAESLKELYQLCLTDAAKQVAAMRTAAAAGEDEALRKSAHAIKGSLGMVGARELQGMCGVLEEAGLGDDDVSPLAEMPAALDRLRAMLAALGVQLDR